MNRKHCMDASPWLHSVKIIYRTQLANELTNPHTNLMKTFKGNE